jgi:hypothetical protein
VDHVSRGERVGERVSERVLGAPSKLVLAVATIAYVVTAPRHVVGGDDAELATLLTTGGAAHAPGYPLYVLYLRLFRALPAASPAHAAALATAVLGVLSVVLIQRACRAWGAREGATAVASAVYALSPLAWGLATRAEPFALETVLAAAILCLAAPGSTVRGAPRALGLGLLFGLGMSNEPTLAALAPLALSGALRGVADVARERSFARAAAAGLGAVAAFALGLAPYAYTYACVSRDPAALPFAWGGVHDATSFVAFLLGGRPPDADPSAVEHVTALLWRVTSELQGLPLLSIVAVIVGAGRARPPSRTARVVAAMPVALLLTAFTLSGPVFAAHLDLAVHGPGGALTERYYLLPMVILTVLGARGVEALFGALLSRDAIAFGTTVSLLAASAVLSLPEVRSTNRPVVELYAMNTLRSLPPGAVVLASTDIRSGALAYAQSALHVRPDVTVIATRRLAEPWYRARVAEALGATFPIVPDDGADARAIVTALDRPSAPPVFFTDATLAESTVAGERLVAYALGTLVRVARAGDAAPDLDAWQRANESIAASYEAEPGPRPLDSHGEPLGDAWADDLAADYARPWLALAAARERAGDSRGARADRDRGAAGPP